MRSVIREAASRWWNVMNHSVSAPIMFLIYVKVYTYMEIQTETGHYEPLTNKPNIV